MGLTVQDKALALDGSPLASKAVKASPTVLAPFVKRSDNVYRVGENTSFSVTTGADGLWTLTLPWPSETREGSHLQWQITLPDGTMLAGAVPDLVAGPLSLDTLTQTYGWGKVTTQVVQVVAIVGPVGPQGSPGGNAVATPVALGGVYVDQSPPLSAVPVALTTTSLAAPSSGGVTGVASLDSSAHVPLAQLSGIGAAQLAAASILGGAQGQLSLTAGIVSSQIASVDAARLTGGVVPDAQLPSTIARLTAYNVWTTATKSSTVEAPAQLFNPAALTLGANLAISRTYRFLGRSLGGAFTATKAVTLAIGGPPTSGGATITTGWALNIEAGALAMDAVPPTSANYGQISLGPGPWDGTTSGKFVGNSSGTYIAIDTGGEASDFLHFMEAGTTRVRMRGDHNQSSGTGNVLQLAPLIQQTGTAGYNGILLNVQENGTGSGSNAFLRIQKSSVDQFVISNSGDLTLFDGATIALGTGTGTKFGTSTSQKLGFWNAPPVIKGTVSGSRGSNAALASLLTLLASYGLLTDSSS
jgi:hypothetical protein